MASKEFLFVTFFTLVMGLCWLFIAGIIQEQKTAHTTEYLCNKRTLLLRYTFPGCQYTSEGSINGKNVMEQYSSGNTYVRSLGYMTFSGRYEGFQIDDAITEYDTKGSDLPDDYYESLLFRYRIPADSPVYRLGYLQVRRVGKARSLVNRAVNSVKNRNSDRLGGSDIGRTKYFSIGNTDIEAAIPAYSDQDRWLMLLGQGLSEKIEVLFRMYAKVSHIEMVYDNDTLFLCVSISLGHDRKFDQERDFVIKNIELISRTMSEMEGLV